MITAQAIVAIMPAYFGTQQMMLFRHWFMTIPFAPIPDGREGRAELLALGLAFYRKPSPQGLPPIVGEAQEVEGLRLVSALPRMPEVHYPRFIRMYRQPVVLESLGHLRQKRLSKNQHTTQP